MRRKPLCVLPLVFFALFSCSLNQGNDSGLPGRAIYTLSSSQLPGQPSTVLFQVDINAAARQELHRELGSDYLSPEVLYFWLAAQSKSGAYDLMGNDTYRAIYQLPLSKDLSVLHYEGSFDLLELKMNDHREGLEWLKDSMFGLTADKLTGYGLVSSDGWWGYGPAGYIVEGVTFRDTLPDGQGKSNFVQVKVSQ